MIRPLAKDIIYSGKGDAYEVKRVWYVGSTISSIDIQQIDTNFSYTITLDTFNEKFRFKK